MKKLKDAIQKVYLKKSNLAIDCRLIDKKEWMHMFLIVL